MKNIQFIVLLTLCLTILVGFSRTGECGGERKETSEAFEKAKIKAGLDKMRIGVGYEIVVADECDPVETVAARMMQRLLAKASLPVDIVPESKATGKKRFILGRELNLEAIRDIGDKGDVNIRNVSDQDDGFHLKQIGDDIVVAGANPRGVLYGVYAFEDFINAGANGKLDIRKIPYFRKRGSAPGYYWNNYENLMTEDFPEERAEYLSCLGINQLTLNYNGKLTEYVKSDVFPFQTPPNPVKQRRLKLISSRCKKYGIDYYMMLTLPVFPKLEGDLEKYPEEALGTVKFGENTERTLCVSSPIAQKHLRNIMQKLVREYPDVKGVYMYNMDIATWICTPELCPRCKLVCTDSPPNVSNPWETQANLVTLLAEAAHEENPDFDFRFWGTIHYPADRVEKLLRAAQGYDSQVSAWHGDDHDVWVPDGVKPTKHFIDARKVSEERDIPLYMVHEFNNHEAVPRGFPFPFHVCDALKKYKQWGVKCIEEHAGPIAGLNSINALVVKEFEWNPDQNAEEYLTDLSVRQFGEKAGKEMYKAWKEIERAYDVWNDMPMRNPLRGSHFQMSFGTAVVMPPVLPDIVSAWGYQNNVTMKYLDNMERMNVHFAQAAKHAKEAVDMADDYEFIEFCYYDGRPTQKEYAEMNYGSIAVADALCAQRCNTYRANQLLTEIEDYRTAGDENSAREKEELYRELVREDIALQESYCDLLEGFAKMKPCQTRTSMTEREIDVLLSRTKEKINILKEYLAQ